MATNIEDWLDQHGLAKYADSFAANDIGLDIVSQLSEEDLKELGLSLGDRKRLSIAVRQLGEGTAFPGEKISESAAQTTEPERRHLTVMFCDLVGSTGLSEQMDPEDFRGIIAEFQGAVRAAVERFDGYIARYMGDGLLVYFGYPLAHEDDAERAVRAGLGVVDAMARLKARETTPLEVRVGMATGLVVAGDIVGEGASEERAVLGDTPNLAARLQGAAGPNQVIVSENTYRLVEGLFEAEPLRGLALKGISSPVNAFRVEGESGVSSRFEAAAARGLVPLIGRDSELGLLSARWRQAREGEGQVFLLAGEAGVGKSRIVRGLIDQASTDFHVRGLFAGSPYHTNSAYYPVMQQLRRSFGLAPRAEAAGALEKLERGVAQIGLDVDETAPVLASLLSVPIGNSYAEIELSPQGLREKTLDVLERLIAAQAAMRPLLLVVEDAHWLDASTLELLNLVIERAQASRILLLITFRPEFDPPWLGHAHVTAHTLNRLGRSDTARLVREVSGESELPRDLVEDIVGKTDGVPLFIEELTKAVLASGLSRQPPSNNLLGGTVPVGAVPASLQDSLMARLDQLAPVKQVAQFAAVLGRTFSREQLFAASPFEEDLVETALDQLVGSELIYRRGTEPNLRFEFKHALVRDAAYESLLKNTRQEYHARVARALEQHFPEMLETEPEQIARHLTEAGMSDQAVSYWHRAGKQALDRSALAEAIAQLDHGTRLIRALPDTFERKRKELELQLLLASAHTQRGIHLEGAHSAQFRAKELADEVGDIDQRFQAGFGVYMVHQHGGELEAAREATNELLSVADQQDDPGLKLEACHAGWTSRFVAEELSSVVELTERGMALYDVERFRTHRYRFGHDPGACAMTLNACTKMFLGFPEQAKCRAEDARALASDLDHPGSEAMTLSFCTNVFRLRNEPEVVESWIGAQLQLCEKYGFPGQLPFGHVIQGWALCAQERDRGIGLILKGLETIRSFGIKTLSFQLCCLADAYRSLGRYEEGLNAVEDAIQVVETVKEHRWEPEIYRLKGEMLVASEGDEHEAERAFRRAIGMAHAQGARWFELRGATSLAALWSARGRHKEARAVLLPVYDWFSEGFDTRDLRRASSLLEELT